MKAVLTALVVLLAAASPAATQPLPAPTQNAQPQNDQPKVALLGLDALGMDPEQVLRLETLFRKELERLTKGMVPSRKSLARLPRALRNSLRNCDGGSKCLGAIGKALKVDYVVAGNIAALGDTYVLNIKAVAAGTGHELRRIVSDPLRGSPDELIESIRVAAYRLLAPHSLKGSIVVLADRKGAEVQLDGKRIGTTPLGGAIEGLSLGNHELKVSAGAFGEFASKVRVRFQKTTRVAVQLVDLRVKAVATPIRTVPLIVTRYRPKHWYQSTWFLVSAGVGAVVVGAIIGSQLAAQQAISCDATKVSPCVN